HRNPPAFRLGENSTYSCTGFSGGLPDELPQLFNVLRGEMSLVGPRPIITDELARYNDEVAYYLLSKPGMTGLWQVSGRSDVDYDTRVYLDAWYVKNWSMWNDIAILFKTVGVVLKRDGAY
ncbi:sugar transferase, partial [Klebsiella pneumoniae]|uniref:sugar transferase n=1 Tax=Klebsiella pneumoniae TaxID=573 RepID=UPI002181EA09